MRPEGLEPSRLAALDPKSNVATNYTTAAIFTAKVSIYFYLQLYCFVANSQNDAEGGWLGGKPGGKWDLAEGVSSRGGGATSAQLLKKADERRGEGVIAQFAPVYPLVLGAP